MMTFKTKMWMLPIIAVLIVVTGIAINARLTASTSANLERLERVQYPALEALRTMRTALQSMRDSLQQAVAEGDDARLSTAQEHASVYRSQVAALRALGEGESAMAEQLGHAFDEYHAVALEATRVLVDKERGDANGPSARTNFGEALLPPPRKMPAVLGYSFQISSGPMVVY